MSAHTFWTLTTVGILVGALASLSSAEYGFTRVIIPCAGNDTTFKCVKDGKCISTKYVCDDVKHCEDNSDEEACETEQCDEKQFFTCHSDNECIPISWHCDGQNDCTDGSDEIACTPANTTIAACSGSEFQCKQGLCIPHIWHCDGHPDCLDDSDEKDCDPYEVHKVPCHEFSCGDTPQDSCIPKRWVCDGVADCPNGSDEGTILPPLC